MENYLGKPLYIFLSILLVITLVLFMNYEWTPLSYNNPINSQKFGDFATFISAFATTATLILLAKQIDEMRRVASHPDLYASASSFITKDDNIPHFHKETNGKVSDLALSNISLYNIGLGAAKEITVKWIYSEKEVKEFIKGKYEPLFIEECDKKYDFIPTESCINISLPQNYMFCCGQKCNPQPDIVNIKKALNHLYSLKLLTRTFSTERARKNST